VAFMDDLIPLMASTVMRYANTGGRDQFGKPIYNTGGTSYRCHISGPELTRAGNQQGADFVPEQKIYLETVVAGAKEDDRWVLSDNTEPIVSRVDNYEDETGPICTVLTMGRA
jgi:hypothetical protein